MPMPAELKAKLPELLPQLGRIADRWAQQDDSDEGHLSTWKR